MEGPYICLLYTLDALMPAVILLAKGAVAVKSRNPLYGYKTPPKVRSIGELVHVESFVAQQKLKALLSASDNY